MVVFLVEVNMRHIISFLLMMGMSGWSIALLFKEKEVGWMLIWFVMVIFCSLTSIGHFICAFQEKDDQDGIPK